MGFFDRFKKDKGIELTAPMKGKCVSIKEVPDPTFAEEILGKGIAVIPQDGHVYAPADGKISTVFPTGHAVGITTADGAEILIHIGLDTVELKGEPFEQKVKEGQDVKKRTYGFAQKSFHDAVEVERREMGNLGQRFRGEDGCRPCGGPQHQR